MSIEKRLAAWSKQSGLAPTPAEQQFISDLRKAREAGVGYGWMQQVIEWEWQEKNPGMSWGPEYYEGTRRELERQLAQRPEARTTFTEDQVIALMDEVRETGHCATNKDILGHFYRGDMNVSRQSEEK